MLAAPIHQDGRIEHDSFFEDVTRTSVIVDMREFRASLPLELHKHNMSVIPCTLEVGDYILSPTICVERKSLSDLIGSFKSGRLYSQCESMSHYYEQPCLLIELGEDVIPEDVKEKLVVLLITFPKVRVLWSLAGDESAQIFKELKVRYLFWICRLIW